MRDEVPARGRSTRATTGLLVLAWVLLCGAVLGVGWLLVHPLAASVGGVDDDLALWLAGHRTSALDGLAAVGQVPGNTISGQIVLLVIAVGFSWWQRSWVPAIFVVVVDAGQLGIYLAATQLVPRQRPPVRILDPGLVPDHSFPSGHVATSVAICGSLVLLTWTYRRTARWWTSPLLLVPLCVATARLYQGAHHLSDVLTSLVFATLWLGVVAALLLRD